MRLTKKSTKKIFQKIINKSKNFSKKLKKTAKNKSNKSNKNNLSFTNCENFCKKDYMIEMNKVFKKSAEKYNIPYTLPTKKSNEYAYNVCKKTFCNEKCDGYDFSGDKQQQMNFKKKIINGFQNTYSKSKIQQYKNRGALSACVDVADYDVFHK